MTFDALPSWVPWAGAWIALTLAGIAALSLARAFGLVDEDKARALTVALAAFSGVGLLFVVWYALKGSLSADESDEEATKGQDKTYRPQIHTGAAEDAAQADEEISGPRPNPDDGLDDLYEYSKSRDD